MSKPNDNFRIFWTTLYALQGDEVSAFSSLFGCIDLLFEPLGDVTAGAFRNFAARFMAMQATHNVFENVFIDYKEIADVASMAQLKAVDARHLKQQVANTLTDSYVKYRVLNKAGFISRTLKDLPSLRKAYRRDLTKYYFDFNHIRAIRNSVAHGDGFIGDEYYVSLLLQLFRNVIAFRIACFDALREMSSVQINQLGTSQMPGDALYNLCFKLLLMDSEFLLQNGRSIWFSSNNLYSLHMAGWAGWARSDLRTFILQHVSDFHSIKRYEPTDVVYDEKNKRLFDAVENTEII